MVESAPVMAVKSGTTPLDPVRLAAATLHPPAVRLAGDTTFAPVHSPAKWQRKPIQESAYRYQKGVDSGEEVLVGVNRYEKSVAGGLGQQAGEIFPWVFPSISSTGPSASASASIPVPRVALAASTPRRM